MSSEYVPPHNAVSRAGAGVVGGVAGGLVFGLVLFVFGQLDLVGRMIGNDTLSVQITVLLAATAVVGAVFGAALGQWISRQMVSAIGVGLLYGGALWALTTLILAPLRLGTALFSFDNDTMLSLAGHAAFGVLLGVVYAIAGPRRYYRYRYRDRAFGLVAVASRRRGRKRDDDEDYDD
jgi:hypothetical protein